MSRVGIIGGGVGGLVCGTALAKSGLEVILFEQHDKVGGYAQGWTRKFTKKGFVADFELTHAVSDFLPGQEMYELYKELGVDMDKIPFIAAPKFAALRFHGEEPLEILNDFKQNKDLLLNKYGNNFVNESKGIRKYFEILEKLEQERPTSYINNKLLRTLSFVFTKPTFVKYRNHTFKGILDECFKSEEIKTHLSALYGYIGLPSEEASGLLTSLMQVAYFRSGGALAPEKTSYQAMHKELANAFEGHGGEIMLNSEARPHINKKNKLEGVVVTPKRGREYFLDSDCVVSAGDMKRTLLPLKKHLPKRYVKKLEETTMSISFVSTKLVIEKDLSGLEEKLGYAANVLASSEEAMQKVRDLDFPKDYVIYVSVPTVLRPEANLVRDLEGNKLENYHIVDMVMPSSLTVDLWETAKEESKRVYQLSKKGCGNLMTQITEQELIPGLRDSVKDMDVATPATYKRYGLTTDGAVYTFDATPKQFIDRFSARTPIKGLYVTGASILSAGVVGAISAGKITADMMLKDVK